jgi:hypothetical protein
MKGRTPSKSVRTGSRASKETTEQVLAKMLAIINSQPGIRPSELNRRLKRERSDSLRAALIRRDLVRKVKDGRATHLYPK